jgi:hypothetical protein
MAQFLINKRMQYELALYSFKIHIYLDSLSIYIQRESWVMMVHVSNPSYLGGWDWEACG